MSYLVLARKYRPKTFAEVCGQEVVTRVLAGAITEQRIGHAYLFCGPRGTGKTTSARLFAKALNCERGPTPEPCGECERCRSLDAGSEVDVVEVDAASNTGVDFVRELRDQAAYMPLRARHKVYVIDEVHMLSRSAFNALLKTLEEPPAHVKFLFATTEPHKVPDTILSRCQVLRLAPIPEETIAARLSEIFALERVDAEEGVALELARRARGGMRDALSMADQLLASVGSAPRFADLAAISGEGSSALVETLVERALAGDRRGVLEALPTVAGGEDQLLSALLDHLRGCLLAALCGADAPMLAGAHGAEARARLERRGKALGAERLELWLQEALHARERLRTLPAHARLVLETTLLDLCREARTVPLGELVERLAALEQRLGGASVDELPPADEVTPAAAPAPPVRRAPPSPPPSAPARTPTPAAGPSDRTSRVRASSTAEAWRGFLGELGQRSRGLGDLLERRGRLAHYASGRAVVQLSDLRDDERTLVAEERNRRLCSKAFSEAVGQAVDVVLEDTAGARPGAEDPFTQEVADLFEGRIEE